MKYFYSCFILLLLPLIVVLIVFYTFQRSIHTKFVNIFSEQYTNEWPECFGREAFKTQLRELMGNPNPFGIIFITGKKYSGKTTVIKSALVDREYVIYIDWRADHITSEDELNRSLKKAFQIQQFKDFMKDFFTPRFLAFAIHFLPRFDYSGESTDLKSTFTEIEATLKHAKNLPLFVFNSVAHRPVIYIDEIGNMIALAKNHPSAARQFTDWLVKISKDMMLCDVVFSSHDGFAIEQINLADPAQTTSRVIPNFAMTDFHSIQRARPKLTEEMFGKIMNKVGGHAYHVVKVLTSFSNNSTISNEEREFEVNEVLSQLALSERQSIEKIYKGSSNYCSYFASYTCYTKADFDQIMRQIASSKTNSDNNDPEIPLETLKRESKVGEHVVMHLVNLGYLFYNPATNVVQSRNKLFFQEYRFMNNAVEKVTTLKDAIAEAEERVKWMFDKELAAKKRKKIEEMKAQLEYEEKKLRSWLR